MPGSVCTQHLLETRRVNSQPNLTQVLAGELHLDACRCRITFGRCCEIYSRGQQTVATIAPGSLPETLSHRRLSSPADRFRLASLLGAAISGEGDP